MINAYKIFTSDTWHNKPKRIRIFPNDFNSRFLQDFSVNITTIIQTDMKGEITHNIESVPKVSHLWGKMDFL